MSRGGRIVGVSALRGGGGGWRRAVARGSPHARGPEAWSGWCCTASGRHGAITMCHSLAMRAKRGNALREPSGLSVSTDGSRAVGARRRFLLSLRRAISLVRYTHSRDRPRRRAGRMRLMNRQEEKRKKNTPIGEPHDRAHAYMPTAPPPLTPAPARCPRRRPSQPTRPAPSSRSWD